MYCRRRSVDNFQPPASYVNAATTVAGVQVMQPLGEGYTAASQPFLVPEPDTHGNLRPCCVGGFGAAFVVHHDPEDINLRLWGDHLLS